MLFQISAPITDAVLVQCVNPPLDLPPPETSIIKTINKKHSENLKCEPDVFIKIESAMGGVNGGRIVNAHPNIDRPSETDSEEFESESESEESSLPDGDMQDGNTMTEEIVPNGLHPDNG